MKVKKAMGPDGISSRLPKSCADQLCRNVEYIFNMSLKVGKVPLLWKTCVAYQPGIGVDDTIIFLLDRSLSLLEKPGSSVRIMFFDFSSSFSAIQPALLGDKLELTGVNQHLMSWILDYLTNRPQYVRTQDYVSDTIICSTVTHREQTWTPFLFTLYTTDFYHQSPHCHLQKLSSAVSETGMTAPT